jgi:hypothetical protein
VHRQSKSGNNRIVKEFGRIGIGPDWIVPKGNGPSFLSDSAYAVLAERIIGIMRL